MLCTTDKPDFKFSVYLEHMFWTVRPSMVPNTSGKSEDETRLARKLRKWTARLQKLHGAKVVASTRHFSSYNASLHRCATLPQKVRIPKDQQTFKTCRYWIANHEFCSLFSFSIVLHLSHLFAISLRHVLLQTQMPSTSTWLSSSSVIPPASAQEAKAGKGMFPV